MVKDHGHINQVIYKKIPVKSINISAKTVKNRITYFLKYYELF